jgi:hypothetical protein
VPYAAPIRSHNITPLLWITSFQLLTVKAEAPGLCTAPFTWPLQVKVPPALPICRCLSTFAPGGAHISTTIPQQTSHSLNPSTTDTHMKAVTASHPAPPHMSPGAACPAHLPISAGLTPLPSSSCSTAVAAIDTTSSLSPQNVIAC